MSDQNGSGGETAAAIAPSATAPGRDEGASEVEVASRLAGIEARFGDRLTDEHRAQIRRAIERQMALAARLRRTPLTNADEPEIVFRPYRGFEGMSGGEQRG